MHVVGDGKSTRFWHDVWVGNIPLKIRFPSLFWAAVNQDASVADNYELDSHTWNINFKRSFSRNDMENWELILDMIQFTFLSDQKDRVRWAFEKKGEFSVKSMYRWLAYGGVSDPTLKKIWRLKIPLKIRVFLWQVIHDRLPTREQILKRYGPTDGKCPLCGSSETLDHLMFQCATAVFVWSVIRDTLDWPACPQNLTEVLSLTKNGPTEIFSVSWIGIAAVWWSLWTIRNKLIFEKKIIKKPYDAIFRILYFLQEWRVLWDTKTQEFLDWVPRECRRKMRSL